jgi:predicted dienelactone hydrolase
MEAAPKPGPAIGPYDPFLRGPNPAGVRTRTALDGARKRSFPCEIWYPAAAQHAGEDLEPQTQDCFSAPGRDRSRRQMAVRDAVAKPENHPLVIFSHPSGYHRRAATFLCTHLASHGYVVGALDHSELVAPELARREGETSEQRAARAEAWIASRVPDARLLLDFMLERVNGQSDIQLDPTRIGIVGHSFGGWTALATTVVDRRIRAVVALAPAGSTQPKPGILPVRLAFDWGRDVPTLYLVGESDIMTPLAGMYELFERTRATKRMLILRRADHSHFMDDIEREHELVRQMPFTGELAWIPKEMRPIAELCSEQHAQLFVRGLTVCHLDATLKGQEPAQRLMAGDLQAVLADRGVAALDIKL